MQTIIINIKDEQLSTKVLWLLEHFKNDGVEILSIEDSEDLKALQSTRDEERTDTQEPQPLNPRKSLRGALKQYAKPEMTQDECYDD